jgi:hypothetical protein
MSKEKIGGHWKNRRRAIIGMHDTYKLQMVVEDQIMSKSSEWITDRLPTKADVHADGRVWIMYEGDVVMCRFETVEPGEPWQHIIRPAPYVKPKRWTVEWYDPNNCWHVIDTTIDGVMGYLHLDITHENAAQRIADIYNEVMP